ncbi:antitoxin Phd [Anaerocolumna jejuensis DSM 15929]|uniref:Antitoxin Phd n=1 Tax=Anaerocolumna jejuensis DSM 15929 TaxID=1121322 RepID=A0A1M7ALZ1_9FIRM|nr:type II toxin-antitoxin system Phd/YefM family antitoxin [Anaerocolumna jejuensis]SHL43793.1 antitoxin Phd [Anaerocolumna jejuensis DSM 15929]
MVDEKGSAVILKNNAPRYIIIDYSKIQDEVTDDNLMVEEAARKFLSRYAEA